MNTMTALVADVARIAREAGEIVCAHAQKPRDIQHKGRIDLVTATDLAVESFLRDKLATLLPGSHFLAEESSPDAALADNTWILDPVDGTTNFAHGLPFVAISIGLWRDADVALGVVHAPLLGECFTAVRGQGAFLNGKPIAVSRTGDLLLSLISTGFPYAIEEELPSLLRRLGRVLAQTQGVRRYGAASLDLAYVATGQYEGFYERRLNPWDVAAGWLLVREAGGMMTRLDGSPFHIRSHEVLATNGAIHTALQALMRDDDGAVV